MPCAQRGRATGEKARQAPLSGEGEGGGEARGGGSGGADGGIVQRRRECAQADPQAVRAARRAGRVRRLAKHRSAARGRAAAAAARREAVAAVVRTAGLTGEAAATSGAAARGGQRRGAGERGARAMSEGRRREMEGGGDGGEGRGGGGGGGGENGGTEFVSVSGAAAGGGAAAALTRCLSAVLSLGSHATATGVPGNGDRARAATHDARAIFAESGPQREAVFSADVQRRARKQAQRRRPSTGSAPGGCAAREPRPEPRQRAARRGARAASVPRAA